MRVALSSLHYAEYSSRLAMALSAQHESPAHFGLHKCRVRPGNFTRICCAADTAGASSTYCTTTRMARRDDARVNHGHRANCISFSNLRIDTAVSKGVLRVIAPLGLEEQAIADREVTVSEDLKKSQ